MIPQSKGKMYVAAERGVTLLPWFNSYNTFNFGAYQHEHKTAFEQLYVLNEEVLAPGRSIDITVEEDTIIVLLPLIGAVTYIDKPGNPTTVVAGALQLFNVYKNRTIALANPYEDEAVNFLQLWIKTPVGQQPVSIPFYIDVDSNINQLPVVVQSNNITIAVGKFEGRQEGEYIISRKGNAVFAFVIDGQMEVQYRLLQARDGLGLWELDKLSFEALSPSAILLVAEVPTIPV